MLWCGRRADVTTGQVFRIVRCRLAQDLKHDIPTPKLGKRWVASAVAIGHRLANEAEKERRRTEELERRRREHARRERRLKRHDFLLNTNS
jgi:hypothetical protein